MAKQINIRLKGKKPTNLPAKNFYRDTGITILEGILLESLESPEDALSEDPEKNRTEAQMKVYRGSGDSWKAHLIEGEEEEITVTNRDDSFSASVDDRIVVYKINGEWRPMAGGGSATKLVKVSTTEPKQKSTVAVQEVKISIPEIEESEVEVELEADMEVAIELVGLPFVALNPRNNFVQHNGLYFATKIGKYWILDNFSFAPWNTGGV